MIEFKNLSVGFNQKAILKNLSGEIREGQLIALMGINGVGKSCFLKTITKLNPAIDGQLKIDGKSFDLYTNLDISKIISVVLTDKIQADFLNVRELISLGRSPHTNFWGEFSKEDNQKINVIIQSLNIQSLENKYFSDLSDGQKQKVLLGRALVQGPRFLFLDEPTTYLDIPSKVELMKVLRVISRDQKVGVFFSTHDLSLVENIVDQIWLFDSEGLLHKKSPEDMKASGLLEKNFNI